MYAIIKNGGKQYRVSEGDYLNAEKIADKEAGDIIELDNILAIGNGDELKLGSPHIDGAKVVAEVVKQFRDDKVIVFKKKRRHNYRRKNGHRQYLTALKIKEIKA